MIIFSRLLSLRCLILYDNGNIDEYQKDLETASERSRHQQNESLFYQCSKKKSKMINLFFLLLFSALNIRVSNERDTENQ